MKGRKGERDGEMGRGRFPSPVEDLGLFAFITFTSDFTFAILHILVIFCVEEVVNNEFVLQKHWRIHEQLIVGMTFYKDTAAQCALSTYDKLEEEGIEGGVFWEMELKGTSVGIVEDHK